MNVTLVVGWDKAENVFEVVDVVRVEPEDRTSPDFLKWLRRFQGSGADRDSVYVIDEVRLLDVDVPQETLDTLFGVKRAVTAVAGARRTLTARERQHLGELVGIWNRDVTTEPNEIRSACLKEMGELLKGIATINSKSGTKELYVTLLSVPDEDKLMSPHWYLSYPLVMMAHRIVGLRESDGSVRVFKDRDE